MRVLVVANMFPTADEPWFGSFVCDQVDDLRALGAELDVFHFDGRDDWRVYLRAIRDVRSRAVGRAYDVVHPHYGLTGAVAVLARPGVPIVTTFHGSDYGGPAWQRVVSLGVARCSTPILVSSQGRSRLRAPRASVIPMGVDIERFAPLDPTAARRELGWSEHGRYALLAGSRANLVKRADLFDAAVRVAQAQMPELEGVALEGFDRNGVALALNAADVTVVASDHEGSPIAVRESLACTTPVVSVAVGDVPSVVAGLPGCAIVARNPRAIADGICDAIHTGRSDALRIRAEQTSRRAVARQVLEVYERCSSSG